MEPTQIAIFKKKEIRKTLHNGEWWFSVIDIIGAVTESDRPRKYWSDLKKKLAQEGYSQLSEKIGQLKLQSSDGKYYETDCGDTETMFRIIQSIPSPKAEPFKRWLAMLYKLKGYPEDWIEKRMRGIAIREELTDEWRQRGAREERDYEILTAEISKATFGVTPSEYKKLKGLKRENLRDHMDDFELIFTMLGERSTTEIHRTEQSKGMKKLASDAKAGGAIAGGARKQLEKRLGRSVVSRKNFKKVGAGKKLK